MLFLFYTVFSFVHTLCGNRFSKFINAEKSILYRKQERICNPCKYILNNVPTVLNFGTKAYIIRGKNTKGEENVS